VLDVDPNNKNTAWATFLAIVLALSITSASFGSQSSSSISSTGTIGYWPRVNMTVNASKVVGINNLSLGFQLDWDRWKKFVDRPTQQQLAQDAGFKLIRLFDFRPSTYGVPRLMPCTSWNESTKTGTWNWASVDSIAQKIFEIGAEPLFCLGYARSSIQNYIPPGMAVDPTTQLPYPDSFAAYASEWVKHFNQLGLPVRFYQIMNEPDAYFGWNADNITKLGYYVDVWNAAARAMRQQNQNILLSQDTIMRKRVLDYWVQYGEDIDFLDFHKYDASEIGQYTDEQMLARAETYFFETGVTMYGVNDARQKWLSLRGKLLPVICSEGNFNSAFTSGTDPKIQQMVGAVWIALVLRMDILKGVNYNIYFEFSSSKSWQETHGTGWGFGMTNQDDDAPWFPYYVNKIIGSNLAIGDSLIQTQSSSDDMRTIGWIHNGKIKILLVCKVDQPRTVSMMGISGEMNASWIDNSTPADNPSIQTGPVNATQPITLKGYTVMLIQSP
jgi:hypothetical protein